MREKITPSVVPRASLAVRRIRHALAGRVRQRFCEHVAAAIIGKARGEAGCCDAVRQMHKRRVVCNRRGAGNW